jgi:hypothetical protein
VKAGRDEFSLLKDFSQRGTRDSAFVNMIPSTIALFAKAQARTTYNKWN